MSLNSPTRAAARVRAARRACLPVVLLCALSLGYNLLVGAASAVFPLRRLARRSVAAALAGG